MYFTKKMDHLPLLVRGPFRKNSKIKKTKNKKTKKQKTNDQKPKTKETPK
jgi:hypothetical protein